MTSRRTFLKVAAAAMWAPKVLLRPGIPTEQILLGFVGESSRYSIESPFAVGSLTYATDARAMIRCELSNRVEDGERRLPPAEKVFNDLWRPKEWIPLNEVCQDPVLSVGYGVCPECGGRRISLGDKWPDTPPPPLYDPDDNTCGDSSCQTCHGDHFHGASIAMIGGIKHFSYRLKRIAAIPDVKISPFSTGEHYGLLFRADGFEGISLGVNDYGDQK